MKTFYCIIIALLISQVAYADDELIGPCPTCLPEASAQQNKSIVMILCYEESRKRHIQGSGFFVNQKGDVLTSYHIIAGQKNISIRTSDKKVYKVQGIVAKNIFGDLVQLAVDIPPSEVKPVLLSKHPPQKGEEIIVIGHPLGHRQNMTYGKVASLFPVAGLGNLLQFTAAITSGSSGSPLFNLSGQVIGVASFMLFAEPNAATINYAVPANQFAGR